ncbi:hypothetical protein KCP73_05865 [Salmonella enterica subsp. enterica]|nr:hypothetical protein KCP73_05865 [Salmonella enterica subsp. enterica]
MIRNKLQTGSCLQALPTRRETPRWPTRHKAAPHRLTRKTSSRLKLHARQQCRTQRKRVSKREKSKQPAARGVLTGATCSPVASALGARIQEQNPRR